MKRIKTIKTQNAAELARALRLSPTDALELSVRRELNEKPIKASRPRVMPPCRGRHEPPVR